MVVFQATEETTTSGVEGSVAVDTMGEDTISSIGVVDTRTVSEGTVTAISVVVEAGHTITFIAVEVVGKDTTVSTEGEVWLPI